MASEFEVLELQVASFSELRDKTDKDEVDAKIDPSEDISNVVSTEVNDNEDNWRCRHCTKKYKRRSSLLRHIKVHSAQHICKICTRVFQSEEDLQSHNSEKHSDHFLCDTCGKSFNRSSSLKQHIKICMGTGQSTAHMNAVVRISPLKNCWLITLTATQGTNHIPVRSARKPSPANLVFRTTRQSV